jgi:cobalt-zinc-cadmium efflux system protein
MSKKIVADQSQTSKNSKKAESKHFHHHAEQKKSHKVSFSHHSFDSSAKLLISVGIILIFMTIEIIGGIMSNSLALLADAGHMASDFLALLLSWFSQRYAKRPPDQKRSYGYQRIKIIAAFINSVALFVIAVLIIKEAVERFFGHHEHVEWSIMLPVAICGAVANIIIYFLLSSCQDKTLNIRSAVTHVIGDLMGSCVAIIGALVIKFTNWTFVDPILSLLVVAIIVKIAISIVREALHILLEGTPPHLDNEQVQKLLMDNLGVIEVHHMHIWSLSEEAVIATMHLVIKSNTIGEMPEILRKAKELLHNIGITHVTIEMEEEGWPCSDNKGEIS